MPADDMIAKVLTWLEEGDEAYRVEVAFDLPDFEWVRVDELQDDGDQLSVVYRTVGFMRLGEPVTLICDRTAIKAARLKPYGRYERIAEDCSTDPSHMSDY